MKRFFRAGWLLLVTLSVACGGGGGGKSPSVTTLPPTTPAVAPAETPITTFFQTSFTASKDVEYYDTVHPLGSSAIGPYSWTLAGSLPPGLVSSFEVGDHSMLTVSGTPTMTGAFPVEMTVRDSRQALVAKQTITFTVDSSFGLVKRTIHRGVLNAYYSEFLTVANGVSPYTFSFTGAMPSGMTLDANTGELRGTPTGFGSTIDISAKVIDFAGHTATRQYFAQIMSPLTITGGDQILQKGLSITTGFGILGGISPYRGRLVSGSLPPGMALQDMTNDFAAVGTPTTVGQYTATIEARDSYVPANTAQQTITFFVRERPPVLLTAELPHGTVGVPYQFQISASGGSTPYNFCCSPMPAGLTMSSTGLISGTPTAAGTFNIGTSFSDASVPAFNAGGLILPLTINATLLGRNDSLATATPIDIRNQGPYSLSPYATASGVAKADQDFYKLSVTGGQILSVEVDRDGPYASGWLDPVIEMQDANGARITTCRNRGTTDGLTPKTVDPTPTAFDDPCLNDDIDPGVNQNSALELQVPGTGPQTVYLRVFDLNGRARPEMKYTIQMSVR